MNIIQRAVIFSIVIVCIQCQSSLNDLDADKIKSKIEKGLGDLNIDIPDVDLNSTSMPNAEDIEKVLREKCEKNGATDAVDLIKEEQENARICIEKYVNFTTIEEELEEKKKTGSMDEVFSKYCKKWPDIKGCFDKAVSISRSCMDKKEEDAFNRTLDIINDLQEFMCYKDGDRLAMFVAEGGVECMSERKDGVQECVNKTLGSRIPDADDLSVTNLPVMLFTDRDCDDFEEVRECVNHELEKCKDSTPANIVDAFFKFLKKQLPCKGSLAQKSTKPNSAFAISSSSILLAISFLYVRLY